MILQKVTKEDGCLIIHTDEGQRKIMLTWRGIDTTEEKCQKFLGKKIRHTTYGDYDPKIWFSDVFLEESKN